MKIISITKRDGRKQKYQRAKIAVAIWKSLYAVSKTFEVQRAAERRITKNLLIKSSPEWKESQRLAQIVEQILVKSNGDKHWSVEEIQDAVEQVLLAAGHHEAAQAYILYRNRRAERRSQIQKPRSLKPAEKLSMSENAYRVMSRRYLRKDATGQVIESPLKALERIAAAVASSSGKKWQDQFLAIMTSFEFVPAGCYFRGAGNKKNGSLANCFVLPVGDSIEEIFDAVKWSALIHTRGGGTGFNFSRLRPQGDRVKHGGLAAGVVNFMEAFDAETSIISQGGLHRGANMGILNVDHPDIFEFTRAKAIDGKVSNFNLSVGIFDRFVRAVKNDGLWTLKNPRNNQPTQRLSARSLWQQIVELAHQTGDPGVIFLDTINRHNPVKKTLGPIEATNVCGEQPLHPFDVCNLGSLNLAKFVNQPWWENLNRSGLPRQRWPSLGKNISWNRLEQTTRLAVRFLDQGVSVSTYPIPQIKEMALKLRRIGLGVMGWADMLAQLGVRYDSDEGVKMAEKIMKFIQEISWDESERLAREKAPFPLWPNSNYNSANNLFGQKRKVRNVAVTTIAPTGTISMIADCSSGIEPYFALEYTKNVVGKKGLKYQNKYYQEASKKVGPSKPGRSNLQKIFRTAHDIHPDWHVKMQAAFQRHTDNAVSKTINFPHSATVEEVEQAYLLAWKLGCKGITVYRDGSRDQQVLSVGGRQQQSGRKQSAVSGKRLAKQLVQSQLQITPLSQRRHQFKRRQIVQEVADRFCPECHGSLERLEGCELCHNCGYSRCDL